MFSKLKQMPNRRIEKYSEFRTNQIKSLQTARENCETVR